MNEKPIETQALPPAAVRSSRLLRSRVQVFQAKMSEIQAAAGFLAGTLEGLPDLEVDEAMLFDLRLAVTESFANIIEHSYGHEPDQVMRLGIQLYESRIVIEFEDTGRYPELHRLKWRDLNDYRERGLGLFLISRCMDGVTFFFGRDGVNRLRVSRMFDGDASFRRSPTHLPFHVAVYDSPRALRVCLIGHLDRTRPDPFVELEPFPPSDRVVLDLSQLDFIDVHGTRILLEFLRRMKKKGATMEIREAPAPVKEALARCGFEGTFTAARADEARETTEEERPAESALGRYLPLLRTLGRHFLPSAAVPGRARHDIQDLVETLLPPELHSTGLRGRIAFRAGHSSRAFFVRFVDPPEASGDRTDGVVFLGTFSAPGVRSGIAATHLYAALGAYPDFLRRGQARTLTDFIRLLSSLLRDLLPVASTDAEEESLLLVALEFHAHGVRAHTGNGPVIAQIGGAPLRSMPLGGSENALMESSDCEGLAADAGGDGPSCRIYLGRPSEDVRRRWDTQDIEAVRRAMDGLAEEEADHGVLDVWTCTT